MASCFVTCKNWDNDHRKSTIYGVDFGLDAGNYTITISKEGFITTSFNITIVGGEDMEFNSSITPVGVSATVWNVFYINESGQVCPVNSFGFTSSP